MDIVTVFLLNIYHTIARLIYPIFQKIHGYNIPIPMVILKYKCIF